VTVIAPKVVERIRIWAQERRLKHVAAEYSEGMAQGYFLVIAATDSESVNHAVYVEGQRSAALVNSVDDPANCHFYAPAVVYRGDFQIAISTGGASPALAQPLRKELEEKYGPEYGPWTAWLGRMRALLLKTLPGDERRRQLLHLLAFSRPGKATGRVPKNGGIHGPLET